MTNFDLSSGFTQICSAVYSSGKRTDEKEKRNEKTEGRVVNSFTKR